MDDIIANLKTQLDKLQKIKPGTHNTAVAGAQIKSAIEYLERGVQEAQPAAAPAAPVAPPIPAAK